MKLTRDYTKKLTPARRDSQIGQLRMAEARRQSARAKTYTPLTERSSTSTCKVSHEARLKEVEFEISMLKRGLVRI